MPVEGEAYPEFAGVQESADPLDRWVPPAPFDEFGPVDPHAQQSTESPEPPEGTDQPSGREHRWSTRVALLALIPLGLAALAAAGPGNGLPGSEASPAERSYDVRTAAQEMQPTTPAGVVTSALRPIEPYHSAPEPGRSGLFGVGIDGAGAPNPAALVGDVVHLEAGPLGIPGIMMHAYQHAADLMGRVQPGCHLPWTLLAGIGKIESGHAGGGQADANGNTTTRILGPVLDGSLAGNAVITDSDGGALDGNAGYDRAVGPMQFMPGTWKHFGADGNNDGAADPNNVYDAAFAAGRLLCASGGDLSDINATTGAILTYNYSMAYVRNVQAWAKGYATGAYPTPSELPAIGPEDKAIDAPPDLKPAPTPEELPGPKDTPAPPTETNDEGDEVLPGTDVPAQTVDIPGLPPVAVPTLPEFRLPELPCLINCPPPAPAPDGQRGATPEGEPTPPPPGA